MSPMSIFQCDGPRKASLPTFPNVPRAGLAKTDLLSHGTQVPVPEQGVRVACAGTPPYSFAGPTKSTRSPPRLVPERFVPASKLSGSPVEAVKIPLHCQPPIVQRAREFRSLNFGKSQAKDATNICVWSKSEGPVSNWC